MSSDTRTPEANERAGAGGARDLLLAFLLSLPVLLHVLPRALLADDPYPHLAGTGWTVLLLVPAALLLLFSGAARLRHAWPWILTLLVALVSFLSRELSDSLEAERALIHLALLLFAFGAGTALGPRGRTRFTELAILASIAWMGAAFLLGDGPLETRLAGILGDTGSTSQAALPGASLGIACALLRRGPGRWLGALAAVLFFAHAMLAPVLAGAVALGLALLAASLRAGRARIGFALAGALALALPFLQRLRPAEGEAGAPAIAASVRGETGGLPVRLRVAKRALALVLDHPLAGAGPGQFQARFPPYRDPEEIVLSRHGVCSEQDTEVEHAHDDWLEPLVELGLPGGAFWLAGLFLAGLAAWRALASHDATQSAAGCASLACLAGALVHSPFLFNPVAGLLAFALFGTLAGAADPSPPRRGFGSLFGFALLAAAIFAPPLVRHGRGLSEYVRAAREITALESSGVADGVGTRTLLEELERAQDAIARALEAAPASAPARTLAARLATEDDERMLLWERVLLVRPHSAEAWEAIGTCFARKGDVLRARERYERALALVPFHPRILKNLARLELRAGDPAAGMRWIEILRSRGCLDSAWQTGFGAELVLVDGRAEPGAALLLGRPLAELLPEELHAAARDEQDELRSGALECLAQWLWAREHASRGDFPSALRNYRQALTRSRAQAEPGSLPLALETAAAAWRAGRADEARNLIGERRFEERAWNELVPWARAALEESAFYRPRS